MLKKETGGQTDERVVEYVYNALNQLTEAKKDGVTVGSYTYDGTGMRRSKTVNGVKTTFYWDRGNIINEAKGSTITADNLFGPDGIISRSEGGQVNYYYKDGHGDVYYTHPWDDYNTDLEGNYYDYDAYGNQKISNDNDTNPFRYCGEYFDEETGFIYLRNRYYDPSVGRFINEDLVRDGANWYVYGNNNPIRYIDPTGYWAADGSDERFKDSNPIVYQALADLSEAWSNLDNLEKQGYDIGDLKSQVSQMAIKVREVGDKMTVSESNAPWKDQVYGELTATEKVIFASNTTGGVAVGTASTEASNYIKDRYENRADGTTANAIKHAVWNAMSMYNGASNEYTELFTDAHELGNPNNFSNGDNLAHTKMDFFNNDVGRYQATLGFAHEYTRWRVQKNIEDRAYAGGLVIIK